MARKLYVGNLPFSAGEAELQELFATAGAVDSVKVMRDMATGRARGFAFVEMATDNDAQAAPHTSSSHAAPRRPSCPARGSGSGRGAGGSSTPARTARAGDRRRP